MLGGAVLALLVIDVQNDFCPGGALAVPEGDAVVEPSNVLLRHIPLSVLTQDWHPASHTSFASNHAGLAPYASVDLPYGRQVLWPDHCVSGTRGAAFHTDLDVDRATLIVRKGWRASIDSYSAFFENDRTTSTGLGGWLRELGVRRIILSGLALDFCVRYSAIDAVRSGFEVAIARDAVRAIDLGGSAAASWAELDQLGVEVASVDELLG